MWFVNLYSTVSHMTSCKTTGFSDNPGLALRRARDGLNYVRIDWIKSKGNISAHSWFSSNYSVEFRLLANDLCVISNVG